MMKAVTAYDIIVSKKRRNFPASELEITRYYNLLTEPGIISLSKRWGQLVCNSAFQINMGSQQ